RIEIMAPVLRRRHDRARAAGLRGNRITDKGVLRKYRRRIRRQINPRNQIEQIVGTVAEGNLLGLDVEYVGNRESHLKAVRVGVTRQIEHTHRKGVERTQAEV